MKKSLYIILMVLALFSFSEIFSYLFTIVKPDLFDHREKFYSRVNETRLEEFRARASSQLLGWDNPKAISRTDKNCLGEEFSASYGNLRERIHSASSPEEAIIVVAGDSFTHGDEADDADTFPAVLERELDAKVINLGVNGFGPTQALLKLDSTLKHLPNAKIAILTVMYSNMYRMVNSFRPVFHHDTDILYGFKPYVSEGQIKPIIFDNPWQDEKTFLRAADLSFDTDFWHRPQAQFPFTLSVLRSFTVPAGMTTVLAGVGQIMDINRFEMVVPRLGLDKDLVALFERFEEITAKRNIEAIVVLVPPNGKEAPAGDFLLEHLSAQSPEKLKIMNVKGDIDWSRYNLKMDGRCHPSTYGYGIIANQTADFIKPYLHNIEE